MAADAQPLSDASSYADDVLTRTGTSTFSLCVHRTREGLDNFQEVIAEHRVWLKDIAFSPFIPRLEKQQVVTLWKAGKVLRCTRKLFTKRIDIEVRKYHPPPSMARSRIPTGDSGRGKLSGRIGRYQIFHEPAEVEPARAKRSA